MLKKVKLKTFRTIKRISMEIHVPAKDATKNGWFKELLWKTQTQS